MRRIVVMILVLMMIPLAISPIQAEIRTISAQGDYRMGPHDTKDDAIRLATESAKRHALEQVATYLESVTVANATDITKDEIRTYTAGSVRVLDQHTTTTQDGDMTVVQVRLLTQIDTEEAAQAIVALRENEDARLQLAALKRDHEQLQRELSAANRAMAEAATSDQTMQAMRQRREILHRVQSNAMVSQAWTNWAEGAQSDDAPMQVDLARIHALLQMAHNLYPASPHVRAAEKTMRERRPPVPPQPPQSGTARVRMPRHEIVPLPGSGAVPRSLNEITYRTPVGQSHNGQEQGRKGE